MLVKYIRQMKCEVNTISIILCQRDAEPTGKHETGLYMLDVKYVSNILGNIDI